MKYLALLLLSALMLSCGSKGKKKVIEDLPFHKASDAKEYADLILKAIRTDRDEPIQQEYADKNGINADSLRLIVGMYSSAIRGRSDWEYIDVYGDSEVKNDRNGFDYAWLDQSGRLGIQIKIEPQGTSSGFQLKRIAFRSRLDVMESKAFPGGKISDYEKLEYDWEAKMKRTLEAKK